MWQVITPFRYTGVGQKATATTTDVAFTNAVGAAAVTAGTLVSGTRMVVQLSATAQNVRVAVNRAATANDCLIKLTDPPMYMVANAGDVFHVLQDTASGGILSLAEFTA